METTEYASEGLYAGSDGVAPEALVMPDDGAYKPAVDATPDEAGLVGLYAGLVGEYAGLVGEYAGLVGE